MARRSFEREISDLHGDDAEVIEMERAPQIEVSVRAYRHVRKGPEVLLANWPQWLRFQAGIIGVVVLVPLMIALTVGLVAALFVLWLCLREIFRLAFGI